VSLPFLSSWLTYRFVKRQEIAYTVHKEIEKLRGQAVMETEQEKQERIRQEIIRWSNPILGALKELNRRLRNILKDEGYLALSDSYKLLVNPNWSITYEHFMNSTLFLFGQYFAWVQMLQERLSFELFQTQQDKDGFFDAIDEVGKTLARFPTEYQCSGQDTQVFGLQQRSIGELMTIRNEEGNRQFMSYPDFLCKLDEPQFSQHFMPLRALLEDVKPSDECRWRGLQETRKALEELQAHCNRLLGGASPTARFGSWDA
jgi:hypothetical protein